MKYKVVLASASPRRRELLENVGVSPEILVSDAEENTDVSGKTPEEAVKILAHEKGKAVLKYVNTEKDCLKLIVSADTVVVSGSDILGKPKSREEAFRMLKSLSGRGHKVITGVSVSDTKGNSITDYETTEVYFKKLSEEDINNYLDTGEYTDKAGGYGIQGMGAFLVEKICGDYFNVVGLPISKLFDMIKREYNVNLYSFR